MAHFYLLTLINKLQLATKTPCHWPVHLISLFIPYLFLKMSPLAVDQAHDWLRDFCLPTRVRTVKLNITVIH